MLYPKVLIVSRLNWDDSSVSNTLTNIFDQYDASRVARIYIETKKPNTHCCNRFFQISEFALVKKILKWNQKTGREIITNDASSSVPHRENDKIAKQEASVLKWVRSHRAFVFTILRDLLWSLNGWKTKELTQFILDFDPDVIWLDGSPLILMNRLNNYVYKVARKPAVTFLMDDVYCYESCPTLLDKIYKFFLRKHVQKTVSHCQHVFVASPKMKWEYDRIFGINSTFISKSVNGDTLKTNVEIIHRPLRMVYLGNVLIGRLESLICIAECLREINQDGVKIQLSVYTNTDISDVNKKRLMCADGVMLFPPVAYDTVPDIISENDVQVFTESLDGENMSVARLSFSTKIVDYLQSGKCILAVGPKDVAPIEYFQTEDAALVATSKQELRDCLLRLSNEMTIKEYANKAIQCCKRNHDSRNMHRLIYMILNDVAYMKHVNK